MIALAADLLNFLGRSPAAADFDSWLGKHRIHDRPHRLHEDESYPEDEDLARRNALSSEIDEVERFSLALIYVDRGVYAELFGSAAGMRPSDDGNFVLKQVALYGPGVQDYLGFGGALPFGLAFGMTPSQVVAALGPPVVRRTVHGLTCDLWLLDGWQINVSYSEDSRSIAIVHLRHQHVFDRRMFGSEVALIEPLPLDSFALIKLLGASTDDPELRQALGLLGLDATGFDSSICDELPEFIRDFGVTLYFGPAGTKRDAGSIRKVRKQTVLTGFRLNRTGDMASHGYRGSLPFGIQFHDSPFEAQERVGRPPDEQVLNDDTGAFIWNMPNHQLRVMFSLIDFQVYRVSCHLG